MTREKLTKYTTRVPQSTWEKLGWLAAEQGTTRQDTIRRCLKAAVRGVKPPAAAETRAIHAESVEWQEWQELALKLDTTVPKLVRRMFAAAQRKIDNQ
jgi:hypothetical protein